MIYLSLIFYMTKKINVKDLISCKTSLKNLLTPENDNCSRLINGFNKYMFSTDNIYYL